MTQCERCKCFPSHYFEEHSSNALGSVVPRIFCPVCVVVVAGGYLYKAQQRKVQQSAAQGPPPHRTGGHAMTMQQGTEEWKQARCGRVTASRVHDIVAVTRSGASRQAAKITWPIW